MEQVDTDNRAENISAGMTLEYGGFEQVSHAEEHDGDRDGISRVPPHGGRRGSGHPGRDHDEGDTQNRSR